MKAWNAIKLTDLLISYLDRDHTSRMELKVVILDAWDPVERDVEQAVQDEPDNVEGDKVEVEPDDALPPPVLVDLGVEGDGPGDEVDPAEDVADHVQGL